MELNPVVLLFSGAPDEKGKEEEELLELELQQITAIAPSFPKPLSHLTYPSTLPTPTLTLTLSSPSLYPHPSPFLTFILTLPSPLPFPHLYPYPSLTLSSPLPLPPYISPSLHVFSVNWSLKFSDRDSYEVLFFNSSVF